MQSQVGEWFSTIEVLTKCYIDIFSHYIFSYHLVQFSVQQVSLTPPVHSHLTSDGLICSEVLKALNFWLMHFREYVQYR